MKAVFNELLQSIGAFLPNLLGALAILVVGLAAALIIAAAVRALLRRTTIHEKLADNVFGREGGRGMSVEDIIARTVLLVLAVFVLLAFFEALRMTTVSGPASNLLNLVLDYLPRVIGAVVLVLVAWLLADLLRRAIRAVLDRTKLDEKAGGSGKTLAVGRAVAETVYWVTFLLFLPAILEALALRGALEPVKSMLNRVAEFMPNILGAVLIVLVGWFIARLVQHLVTNLLASAGADRLGERIGLEEGTGERKLSGILGLVVYVVILIPVLVAALGALKLDAITLPAVGMLGRVMDAIPLIFGAVVIFAIAYVVARLISTLVANLLAGAGFDNILSRLGITSESATGGAAPSAIVGLIVMVTVMLLAGIEAARLLTFNSLADMLQQVMQFGARVLLGLVIFGVGIFLSNLAAKAVRESDTPRASAIATAARIAILVLAGAMALRQLNVADDIIQLAFALLLGAAAVAAALAFGIGGRESAARLIEEWRQNSKK